VFGDAFAPEETVLPRISIALLLLTWKVCFYCWRDVLDLVEHSFDVIHVLIIREGVPR
jgi:hypothetical protein